MIEDAHRFGEDGNLVGIVCAAGAGERGAEIPGMLILNAGLLHRVGPFRLHVSLARRLATEGYAALRFDLSGIGDSAPRADDRSNDAHAMDDIRQAMDFMEQRVGCRRFVVIGLCSGAKNAHNIALVDERVEGIVLIDGYTYRTWRFYWRHYAPRVARPKTWRNVLRRVLANIVPAGAPAVPERAEDGVGGLSCPPRSKTASELETLAARNVAMLYIYTGGDGTYNYRAQMEDAFRDVDFRGNLQVRFFSRADHTFTRRRDRQPLIENIVDWTRNRFPVSGVGEDVARRGID